MAFEYATLLCERVMFGDGDEEDIAMFMSVPQMLRAVFDADEQKYREESRRAASAQNVTCLRPVLESRPDASGVAIRSDGLMEVELTPGRTCLEGECSKECSRVVVPTFATPAECEELSRVAAKLMTGEDEPGADPAAGLSQLDLCQMAAIGDPRPILLFVRLVERLRRAVAYEYGLPLAGLAPHTSFVSRWVAGGGCGSGTPVHGDEAACDGFHYSCVVHLNTQGEEFEGGDFVFSDASEPCCDGCGGGDDGGSGDAAPLAAESTERAPTAEEAREKSTAGRKLTRFSPKRGRAMLFTSGWENLHYVDVVSQGVRHAMPTFFTTYPTYARDGPEDQRGPVAPDFAAGALMDLVINPDGDEDEGQLTHNWHMLFAAPIADGFAGVEEEEVAGRVVPTDMEY